MPTNNSKDPLQQEVKAPTFFKSTNADVFERDISEQDINTDSGPIRKGIKAIKRASKVFKDVEKARNMVNDDPTMTEMQRRISMKKYADKKGQEYDGIVNAAEQPLQKLVNGIDNDIDQQMEQQAQTGNFAKETWKHLRSMEEVSDRRSFVRQAIEAEEWIVVEDVLGVDRGFLVGMQEKDIEMLREHYKQARFADKIKKRDAAQSLLNNFWDGIRAAGDRFTRFDTPEVNEAIGKTNNIKNFLHD